MKNILLLAGLLTFTGYAMEIENNDDSSSGDDVVILEKAPIMPEKKQEAPYTLKMLLPFLPIKEIKSQEEHVELLKISMTHVFEQKKLAAKSIKLPVYEIKAIKPVARPKLAPKINDMQDKKTCNLCGNKFEIRGISSHMRACLLKQGKTPKKTDN